MDWKELHAAADGIVAAAADRDTVTLAEEAMGAVFEQADAARVAQRAQRRQILRDAEKMGDHDGLDARMPGQPGLDIGQVGAGVGQYPVEHHFCAAPVHRRNHRRAVISRHQHQVTGAHAQRAQRQANGNAPAGNQAGLGAVQQRWQRAAGVRTVTKCSERQHGNGRDQAANGNAGVYTRHHRNIPCCPLRPRVSFPQGIGERITRAFPIPILTLTCERTQTGRLMIAPVLFCLTGYCCTLLERKK